MVNRLTLIALQKNEMRNHIEDYAIEDEDCCLN